MKKSGYNLIVNKYKKKCSKIKKDAQVNDSKLKLINDSQQEIDDQLVNETEDFINRLADMDLEIELDALESDHKKVA